MNRIHDDFMIIARSESLLLEKGRNSDLTRAYAYVKAEVDGIMINSRKMIQQKLWNLQLNSEIHIKIFHLFASLPVIHRYHLKHYLNLDLIWLFMLIIYLDHRM